MLKQIVIEALQKVTIVNTVPIRGAIIDTSDYVGGIYFAIRAQSYVQGSVELTAEHGDESDLSDAVLIPEPQWAYTNQAIISSNTVAGVDHLTKQGYFGTRRYIRPIAQGIAPVNVIIEVIAIANPAVIPVGQGGI